MDMSTMTMSSMGSMTISSASAVAATTSPGMSMGGSSGMDMGEDMGPAACKISMLWNWYTIDACFLARSWHVRSSGVFAASCIGVVLLVISLELLRLTQREFDRYLSRPYTRIGSEPGSGSDEPDGVKGSQNKVAWFWSGPSSTPSKLKVWQPAVRSLLYMLQFAVGYFIMLLAMYYNGYIIICIFIGAFLGAMIFQWDTFNTLLGLSRRILVVVKRRRCPMVDSPQLLP